MSDQDRQVEPARFLSLREVRLERCAKCRWPPVIGSRCVYHWLKRIVKAKGLEDSQLWKKKQQYLQNIVAGRYLARVEDLDPLPTERILADLRSFRLGEPGKNAIAQIMEAVDEAAAKAKARGYE